MAAFPVFCETISQCVNGEHEDENMAALAAGLIELRDQVVGIHDGLSRVDLIPADDEHRVIKLDP
eukprot:scaffold430137_cov48-Prasinocladus_malaysianus.AAC.1